MNRVRGAFPIPVRCTIFYQVLIWAQSSTWTQSRVGQGGTKICLDAARYGGENIKHAKTSQMQLWYWWFFIGRSRSLHFWTCDLEPQWWPRFTFDETWWSFESCVNEWNIVRFCLNTQSRIQAQPEIPFIFRSIFIRRRNPRRFLKYWNNIAGMRVKRNAMSFENDIYRSIWHVSWMRHKQYMYLEKLEINRWKLCGKYHWPLSIRSTVSWPGFSSLGIRTWRHWNRRTIDVCFGLRPLALGNNVVSPISFSVPPQSALLALLPALPPLAPLLFELLGVAAAGRVVSALTNLQIKSGEHVTP